MLYKNPDNDARPWASDNPFAPGAATHQGMVYAIQHPFTGELMYPPNGRCWTFGQDLMLEHMNAWCPYELQDLHDEEKRATVCGVDKDTVKSGVKAIVLSCPLEVSATMAQAVLDRGSWPRFYFTKGGKGGIRRKTYLENVGGTPPTNLWQYNDVGHTDEAAKILKAIFDGKATFDTPKPPRLIERILQIAGDKDTLILDSFAGSGTTAHAVLDMNKTDGGNRKFLLIEMMDYADSITAERVKRVIDGYGEGKSTVKGTGGDFSYYELGEPLLIGENLNETVGTDKIREYIWYTETKAACKPDAENRSYYLGKHGDTGYYFFYEPDKVTILDHAFLSSIVEKTSDYVIYADRCALSDAELAEYGILFKKIPRDITKI